MIQGLTLHICRVIYDNRGGKRSEGAFREAGASGATLGVTCHGAEIQEVIEGLLKRGLAAHPQLRVAPEAFGRCLARCLSPDSHGALEGLCIEDLYLACACAQGMTGAAAAFEERYSKIIRRAVSRVLHTAVERDEAVQCALDVLLVGDDEALPKISQYLGRGRLENWIVVSAIRIAVSAGRSDSAERRLRAKAANEATDATDPESLYIKAELRPKFEAAIEEALQRLIPRDRLVLKLYLVSGMTLARIGKSFNVTQQTVSRWLERARDTILFDVRHLLAEGLGAGHEDMNSIARLVASQLDVSISRVLGGP